MTRAARLNHKLRHKEMKPAPKALTRTAAIPAQVRMLKPMEQSPALSVLKEIEILNRLLALTVGVTAEMLGR